MRRRRRLTVIGQEGLCAGQIRQEVVVSESSFMLWREMTTTEEEVVYLFVLTGSVNVFMSARAFSTRNKKEKIFAAKPSETCISLFSQRRVLGCGLS
jgi:hypothetical protein